MLAAVLTEPRRFALRQVPIPPVGPDDALIRVARTGICGTDIHIFNGHYAADRLPLIPGHEFTGTIADLGARVRHLAVGARVVVDINIGCGTCFFCARNEVLNCPEVAQVGITCDGAFAEFVSVPARVVLPAPDGVPDAVLALTEPLACVVRAARKARAGVAHSVVILGAGPIGNLHIQMMRLVGAAPIIAADLSPDRCALALAAGADAAVSDPADLPGIVRERTGGRGADIVIESVGHPALYAQAFQLIRKGGHVAAFGLASPGQTVPLDLLRTVLQETSVKGSVAGMGRDMSDALTLLSHNRIQTAPFTGASFPLARIQHAFETLGDRTDALKTQITI